MSTPVDLSDGSFNAKALDRITALEKELTEAKAWSEDLAKQCCEMEDALGFKHDCTGPHGEFVPTMGPWKERVRDLIAEEGQLGDLIQALGMSSPWPVINVLHTLTNWCDHLSYVHDCDCNGHEVRCEAVKAAREMTEKLGLALIEKRTQNEPIRSTCPS